MGTTGWLVCKESDILLNKMEQKASAFYIYYLLAALLNAFTINHKKHFHYSFPWLTSESTINYSGNNEKWKK